MNALKNNNSSTFIEQAASICYLIAFVSFNAIVFYNQFGNIKNHYNFIIGIDLLCIIIVWIFFILYKRKRIGIKLGSAVLAYAIFTDLLMSSFYLYYQSVPIADNFLICTFIFCINIIAVGFCSGRIHLYISATYYILAFLLLLIISRDPFLIENAFVLIFMIGAFTVGLSAFLHLLEKIHNEELELERKLHEKESLLIREQAEKLDLKLEIKQKELTTKAIYLLKLVENNNVFIAKLRELKKDIKKSGLNQFELIVAEHELMHSENYWKEFETCFQEVHDSFYTNLQTYFPDLTPTERRMAAFVRLDLSSKQIADITFNSIHSVEVSRSRLRKKLNLGTQTNLKAFLDKL